MLMRRVSAKEKFNNGPVRAALVAGVASAVAVGSLSGVGPANGTCIGISGINIGSGCASTFGNFALGLGEGTVANSSGGFLNGAIAVGTNVAALAGDPFNTGTFSVANLALNLGSAEDRFTGPFPLSDETAQSVVLAGPGVLNLGANLGGAANSGAGGGVGKQPMQIVAAGFGSSALNFIGNRNRLTSTGILANSTVLGGIAPGANGSDNTVTSEGPLSVAFVRQGIFSEPCELGPCGNVVKATGFGAIAGALNTVGRNVLQNGFGINIATPGNDTGAATTLASAKFAPTTFAGGSSNQSGNQQSGSLTKGSKQFSSSLKNLSDGVKNALSGLGKKKQTSKPDNTDGAE